MAPKRLPDMEPGDWFKVPGSDEVLVLMTGAASRGNGCFQAVSLRTGGPACMCGSGCSPQLANVEYEVVEKPEWALPLVDGELRFDTAAKRDEAVERFKELGVRHICDDQPGAFFLRYKAPPAKKAEIKRTMGGS